MKKNIELVFLTVVMGIVISGCGGGGSSGYETSTPVNDIPTIAPSTNADYMSSYENSKTSIYIDYYLDLPNLGNLLRAAIAYIDADGDGDIDVFIGTGASLIEGEVDSVLALNDGSGKFTASTAEFPDGMPPATHARKTLVSDFNGDGLKDMLILDHGFDAEPFPGNQMKLIIQNSLGSFTWSKLPEIGFFHGGAAGDIDNDGDIDIFAGGFDPFFYINDGSASFTKVDTTFDKVFTAELIDVDKDGFIDLLVGAHEREGDETSIYWGNATGKYTSASRTVLPALAPMGVILDFDVEDTDGDGDRDLIINRTRDGDDGGGLGFYIGRTIQLLQNNGNRDFTDITATNIDNPGSATDEWFPWLRVEDIDGDGDMDIRPDDASRFFEYINDGTGKFRKKELILFPEALFDDRNTWYAVEYNQNTAYCNGVYDNSIPAFVWIKNGVSGTTQVEYSVIDNTIDISYDDKRIKETMLMYDYEVLTTAIEITYDNGSISSGNRKWFKSQVDAENFLATYGEPSCFE